MGIILSAGCSHTVGLDLEEEIGFFNSKMHTYSIMQKKAIQDYRESKNFSTLIGKNFNRKVKNIAWLGNSNERIVRSTVDYIENSDKVIDLVLVNLSSKARFTFNFGGKVMDLAVVHEPEFYLNSWPDSIVRDKDFLPFYRYFRKLTLEDYSLDQYQEHLYRYITLYLESKNIPYLLSPTMHTGVRLSNFTSKCIDISMEEYCKNLGRKRALGAHWLSDSHKDWADLLVEKLSELYEL